MTYHTDSEILSVSRVLAKRVIEFSNKCKNQEHISMDIKCLELEDLAALARMVTCDLDSGND